MSWILLTNDDGTDSPALVPFARALSELADVRVVVPDRERSWVAKAITRFDPVTVMEMDRDGLKVWACSGYPADAVQLGVEGLFPDKPRLVVSGINLGHNHGAAFMMSSGTIGAAVEAWVSGVPSIAFSTGAMTNYAAWREFAESPDAAREWVRLAATCAGLVPILESSNVLDIADVVSVNLPFDAETDTPRRVTTIARIGYDRLFRHVGDGTFVHDFGGGFREFEGLEGTDIEAGRDGHISITPIRLPAAAELPNDVRERLEGSR